MLGNLSKQSCESETALFRAVTSSDKRAFNIGGNNSSWRCEAKETLVPAFTCFIQGETRNRRVHCVPAAVVHQDFLSFPLRFRVPVLGLGC